MWVSALRAAIGSGLVAAVFVSMAAAHPSGVTVTDVYLGTERVELVYTVPTAELWRIAGGQRPTSPLPAGHYGPRVSNGFTLTDDGAPCMEVSRDAETLAEIGSYQFRLGFDCPRPLERLTLTYGLFVEFDRAHRNVVRVFAGELGTRATLHSGLRTLDIPVSRLRDEQGLVLSPLPPKPEPPTNKAPTAATAYFALGIEHLVTGYEHLLFVGGLLLLAPRFAFVAVLVASFTVAYSLTLGLAVLGFNPFPTRLVDGLIALSIAWVGADNLGRVLGEYAGRDLVEPARSEVSRRTPAAIRWRGGAAFGFGLIYGLGFAIPLNDIGLPEQSGPASLALFNLGVETGLVAAVALVYPLLRRVSGRRYYSAAVVAASLVLITVGLAWFAFRVAYN